MTEPNTLAGIESSLVDDVVIGAMAMLVDDTACEVAGNLPLNADDVTVAVYCDNGRAGAVVLRCTKNLANALASTMLELDPEEVGHSDVLDATGELVNVIAGNLRGLVENPGTMTPPFEFERCLYEKFPDGAVNSFHVSGGSMQVLRV